MSVKGNEPALASSANSGKKKYVGAEDVGYKKTLRARQIQMIAIGGAVGSGLFLGAGARLSEAGPSLVFAFAVCGVFAWFIIRALGELVLHRPSTGSFVSYAREFYGEKLAYAAGWMYWTNWVTVAIAELTATALYLNFFKAYVPFLADIPQWVSALGVLAVITGINLVSVKIFGELEFWFAFFKVAALVTFLGVGVYMVVFGTPIDGHVPGFQLISDHGGWFPYGVMPAVILIQGVVFAYGSIELVGTAAGEAKDVEKVMPKAIRAVVFRIVVFYVGTILLLSLLMPSSSYVPGVSPLVTFFGAIGVQGADAIMNMVLFTAAISSLNAGIYTTGRILRSLAVSGSAPAFLVKMNSNGVPFAGIMFTTIASLVGVAMNAFLPDQAFEIAMSLTAILMLGAWGVIIICQLKLYRLSQQGLIERPGFRMMFAPYSGYATLVFFVLVFILIALDYPVGTYSAASVPFYGAILVVGWFMVRGRVNDIASGKLKFDDKQELVSTCDVESGHGLSFKPQLKEVQ
ncbi:L-asparagine permease [Pseudomonas fluorescens]|uniref:L-asparagine permease n=1 Tax=Pseudomonas fluorescens TaxID=294 RepID=A0A327NB85_PSEFL|nr:amino acid permease [Pseudomonas fluorescens]RAI72521.1 L-asparagine permease [Pseudomonas fluorescens]